MTIEVRLETIHFSGGDDVRPPIGGVLLIVGSNNVGKSVALRDIVRLLTEPVTAGSWQPRVVTSLDASKTGDAAQFEEWLNANCRRRDPRPGHPHVTFSGPGMGQAMWPELEQSWNAAPPFRRATPLFVQHMEPGERLNLLGSASLWDAMQEDPHQPLQLLYDTPGLEEELCRAAMEAFGVELFVNRYAGTNIHLQVGSPPEPVPPPAPRELMERLRALPHVQEQGDGLRSFMGILMTLIAGVQRILVVDEPEAFLHPPQAKLLGRKLAQYAPPDRQVIAATHSADVVIGALDAPDASVTIVRLTRTGDINHLAELPHDRLRELWSDPLLRYSNVLDGLFHRAVVVCEGDGDSMFLAAAYDHWLQHNGHPSSEVLFTHSAGKSRMFRVAEALRSVEVPVLVVADIDILNNGAELGRLINSLGADPTDILRLQVMIHADITSSAQNPRREFVSDELTRLLGDCAVGQPVPDDVLRAARTVLKPSRGWPAVKEAGMAMLSGDTLARCRQAFEACADAGLMILDGELESFDRSIVGHGPEWVSEALSSGLHRRSAAQEFAARLADNLARF